MKKLLMSGALIAFGTISANAADLYTPPAVDYTMAPTISSGHNWSGLYIGLHGGYGWSDASANYADPPDGFPFDADCGPLSNWGCAVNAEPDGAFIGAQIGYQHQFGNWVFGIEGDYSYASLNGSGSGVFQFGGSDSETHVDLEVQQLATVQARIGYAWDRWLPFFTVGWGWAEAERSAFNNDTLPIGGSSDKQWHDGLTLGGGVEYAINDRWSVKGEYRWFNGSTETYGVGFAGGTEVDLDIHTVRFGVNYGF